MKRSAETAEAPPAPLLERLFAASFGVFLGLALLKFGNPPIMEKYVAAPTNSWEFVLNTPWPISWAYLLLALITVLGLLVTRWDTRVPRWLIVLPLLWVGWQAMAGAHSVSPPLSRLTLQHFVACVLCFYLGLYSLSRVRPLYLFSSPVACAFMVVVVQGWQQHFGGLEHSRQYFLAYVYPRLPEVSPEYLKKLASNRIFSTLFYPNALAGALLLLSPVVLNTIWSARYKFTTGARAFLIAVITTGTLGCLFWSGSKGGWLLMLLLGLIALLQLRFAKTLKVLLIGAILVVGLAGFFWKYATFFRKGATSVSARFDYWSAAIRTAVANPVFGTGPGTFAIPYQRMKRPESEMARLAHNDYLEQASDSGLPGFVTYLCLVTGVTLFTGRRLCSGMESRFRPGRGIDGPQICQTENTLLFAVWLGLLGWVLQSLVEFSLYIPALAWPAFTFMGLLPGLLSNQREETPTQENPIDKQSPSQ